MQLLEEGMVSEIILNDADRAIYAFWLAPFENTDSFVRDIEMAELSIEEWRRNKELLLNGI